MNEYGNQRGLSLVELMIAMVLGLIIIGGVVAIFVGASGSFALNRELDRSQENLRFVVTMMVNEFRQATRIREDSMNPALAPIVVSPDSSGVTQSVTIRYPVVNAGEAVHCDGSAAQGGTVIEKTFEALADQQGTLRCSSSSRVSGTVTAGPVADVAYGVRRIRVERWIESGVAPAAYSLNERALMSDLAPNQGLGLVGVRFLVEHDDVNGQTRTFVITTALRNAVLQWFTIVPP
jgi:prepilin-type N-terminal cleavage/methylation domain-containing protein